MNTDNLILRETDNLPLINKDDTLTSAELDGNFINIYNDFISLSVASDITLVYDIGRSYLIGEYTTYDGRMWIATSDSTASSPYVGSIDWLDVFPTILSHEKNKDTILDEGGTNETTVAEIRAFIDAGLTSTTNLSLSTKTASSFKIESSTGSDVTIPQATNIEAGLLNATDKVKLDNTTGINTGDQTLISLNAEDVDNKVTDFTTINDVLYPTTQAVDTYVTAVVPDLVETFLDSNVELNTNKATTFSVINDTLYPSVKAVDDQLDLKVDKGIAGERLITVAEATKLSNTSGTNTGDQTISDATITTTDITTNNFTTAKHGFVPKGTNVGNYLKDDGTWGAISAGGLTYFTEAQNTTAPNATVPVDSLTAVSGTTNGDFAIRPKGSGAIITAIPDSGVVNGNKRGTYAVDLSLYRTAANQVAAGAYSGLFAGQRNYLASGQTNCTIIGGQTGNLYGGTESTMISCSGGELNGSNSVIIGGLSSNNFGANCLVTGSSNGASGTSNTITGVSNSGGGTANLLSGSSNATSGTNCLTLGNNNVSTGIRNLLLGQWGNDFGHSARLVIGSFQDIGPYTKGISQLSTLATTYVSTTDTAVELVDRAGKAIALILQDNNAMRIKGSIIGKQTASTNVTSYDFDCVIVRGVGVGTTVLKVNNMNLVFDDIVCTVLPTLTANTTLGGLSIKSGAKLTTTIRWVARIDSTESILA